MMGLVLLIGDLEEWERIIGELLCIGCGEITTQAHGESFAPEQQSVLLELNIKQEHY